MQTLLNTQIDMRIIHILESGCVAPEGAGRTTDSVHTGKSTSLFVSTQSLVSKRRLICQSQLS